MKQFLEMRFLVFHPRKLVPVANRSLKRSCLPKAASHYCKHRRHYEQLSSSSSSSSSSFATETTFYDSQSGIHVPLHVENEITLIMDKSHCPSFVPMQLYKEDFLSSDMPDQLKELSQMGIGGIILPPMSGFPRDFRNLSSLTNIAPTSNFTYFSSFGKNVHPASMPPSNVSLIVPHNSMTDHHNGRDDERSYKTIESSLKSYTNNNVDGRQDDRPIIILSTTISLKDIFLNDHDSFDPLMIANNIAKLIDTTGGGNFIWLSSHTNTGGEDHRIDADDMVQLCEELIYLDVTGATMKSRLMIDSNDEEVIEESMISGVNKFVINNKDQIKLIETIAQAQGKYILASGHDDL